MPEKASEVKTEKRPLSWRFFVVTLVASIAEAFALLALTPRTIYTQAAEQFYVIATTINAAFLIASAATFSGLYKEIPSPHRQGWLRVFVWDLVVLFLGIVFTAVGMLNFIQPYAVSSPAIWILGLYIYFSWTFGFILLAAALVMAARWAPKKEEVKER